MPINGKPNRISAEHEAQINALIPEAIHKANQSVHPDYHTLAPGKWPDPAKIKWNGVFHTAMDDMAKSAGLRF